MNEDTQQAELYTIEEQDPPDQASDLGRDYYYVERVR